MKLAGQHWSDKHGGRMVKLRALYRTVGSIRFYDVINRAYLKTHYRKPKAPQANQTRATPQRPTLRLVS